MLFPYSTICVYCGLIISSCSIYLICVFSYHLYHLSNLLFSSPFDISTFSSFSSPVVPLCLTILSIIKRCRTQGKKCKKECQSLSRLLILFMYSFTNALWIVHNWNSPSYLQSILPTDQFDSIQSFSYWISVNWSWFPSTPLFFMSTVHDSSCHSSLNLLPSLFLSTCSSILTIFSHGPK